MVIEWFMVDEWLILLRCCLRWIFNRSWFLQNIFLGIMVEQVDVFSWIFNFPSFWKKFQKILFQINNFFFNKRLPPEVALRCHQVRSCATLAITACCHYVHLRVAVLLHITSTAQGDGLPLLMVFLATYPFFLI